MSDTNPAPAVKGALGKRIGPLPLAGWIAAIGGGLAISWYLRRHTQAPDGTDQSQGDTVAPTESATPGMGGAAVSDPTYPGNVSAPTYTDEGDGSGTLGTPITNNAEWRQQAVKWLVGNGTGAIEAEMGVANYLSGGTLSMAQGNNINKVIAAIGPTPSPVPTIHVQAPTPPPVKPTANNRPTTNAAWRIAAINHINHVQHHSAVWATEIVGKYLDGRGSALKAAGRNAISKAISALGPPPQPVKRRDTGRHTHPGR